MIPRDVIGCWETNLNSERKPQKHGSAKTCEHEAQLLTFTFGFKTPTLQSGTLLFLYNGSVIIDFRRFQNLGFGSRLNLRLETLCKMYTTPKLMMEPKTAPKLMMEPKTAPKLIMEPKTAPKLIMEPEVEKRPRPQKIPSFKISQTQTVNSQTFVNMVKDGFWKWTMLKSQNIKL